MKTELFYHHKHQPHSLLHCNVAGSQESTGLTDQVLFIQCSGRNFLTIQHVLNITAFCIRIYGAGRRSNSFEVSHKLFGIIPIVDSTIGITYTVFSCHIAISSSFVSYHHHNHHCYFSFFICNIFIF